MKKDEFYFDLSRVVPRLAESQMADAVSAKKISIDRILKGRMGGNRVDLRSLSPLDPKSIF